MFKAQLNESILIKKLIESIKDIVSEINLQVSPLGINLQAMDASHVALVSVGLSSEGFSEYRCDKNMNLGIQVSNLWKLMKCGGNDDALTLSSSSESSKLDIKFENKKLKKCCEFSLNLITIDSEHLGIPETSYGSVVTMSSNEFNRITKELYGLSETVNIETNKSYINFSISTETVTGNIKIDANDSNSQEDMTLVKVEDPVNLAFALRYLNMFTKATALTEQVQLSLSSEYPLKVEYKLSNLGTLQYFLAPRISEDTTAGQ
jgi:proliferating cell nuclear antigen